MFTNTMLTLALLVGGAVTADDRSGPGRATLQSYAWGTVSFDKVLSTTAQWETVNGGLRFTSSQGTVSVEGSALSGWTLRCGKDTLTIQDRNGDLDIRHGGSHWSLNLRNGTLRLQVPGDTLTFSRNTQGFQVEGRQGRIRGESSYGNLTLSGPPGTTWFTHLNGVQTVKGANPHQFPYLGRGFFIPFHGLTVFVDITRYFPLPEIVEWLEWKSVLTT